MARKKLEYDTDRELDGLRWLARVIDFGVSLTIATAINELYTSGHIQGNGEEAG